VRLLSQLQTTLEPHLGSRTQDVLKEGLARLGLEAQSLDPDRASILLKRFVYRALQRQMDAASARKVIEETLRGLTEGGTSQARPAGGVSRKEAPRKRRPKSGASKQAQDSVSEAEVLEALQKTLSRFKLYFEWPEVQRLRSLAALLEADTGGGDSPVELLIEAQNQIELLEEKLQNALLRQARDISDLEDALERVKTIGGPKPKRLRSLLKQIKEAQQQETLATAEVERARKLAADLRKLVESSVVQNPTLVPEMSPEAPPEPVSDSTGGAGVIALEDDDSPELTLGLEEEESGDDEEFEILIDFDNLEPEVADRIREIDLAEERRRLERLKEQYASVTGVEAVAGLLAEVESILDSGELAGDRMNDLQSALENAFKDAVAEARARYEWLTEKLRNLELEDTELDSRPARTQLELIKESLDMGVLPSDLEQAERQVKALEESLAAKKQEQARHGRLLEEARGFVKHAREALPEGEQPELAVFVENLAALEAGLEAGKVDEPLLNRLKSELPELLSQLASSGEAARALSSRLLAELDALPDLEALVSEREALKRKIENGSPAGLEEEVARLVERARQGVLERLDVLKGMLTPFTRDVAFLDEARAQMEGGRFPDLSSLERRVEQLISEARDKARRELRSLRASAERLRELGGEELLAQVAEAESALEQKIPDLTPLKEKLQALLEKRESWRRELDQRYQKVRERFEVARAVGGETAYRALTLLNFLEKGARRIERLGTSGLVEMEKSLNEAEQLVTQLEQEYSAAKEVAEQLSGNELNNLLDVFESPSEPALAVEVEKGEMEPVAPEPSAGAAPAPGLRPGAPAAREIGDESLAPFDVRGVLWATWLEDRPPTGLDTGLTRDLLADLDLLKEEAGAQSLRLTVLTFPGHVFLVYHEGERHLVILAEKSLLSRLITTIRRHFSTPS